MELRLEAITKSVGEATILRDVFLTVPSGEMVAITGPSGSGKTTLLNIIGLMDDPTTGSRHLGPCDATALKSQAADRLRASSIGFVFQDFHLLPDRSVWDNVALGAVYSSVPRAQRSERICRLLDRVGLADRARSEVHVLSGGERQRVAICRALISEPGLLLCDEPTGSLDERNSRQIMGLIAELRAELGFTIVLVTHDSAVAGTADWAMQCIDGRLV